MYEAYVPLPRVDAVRRRAAARRPLTLTDLAGRQVTLNAPAQRIVLGDSRLLLALSLLHPGDPLRGIVAWDDSLRRRAPDMARRYAQAYPRLTQIPVFANPYRSDLSVEFLLPLRPELAIFDLGLLPRLRESGTLALLEKAASPPCLSTSAASRCTTPSPPCVCWDRRWANPPTPNALSPAISSCSSAYSGGWPRFRTPSAPAWCSKTTPA
ncbi:hypothetical protein N4G58_05395 [Edwardsiella piscicida]|nr:hypothetical protein N4G58_05395 [Edwardsiella piscicida]